MQKRQLGRTGLQVSLLTFGCGAVGGLMTKGEPKDQERAVARALELDINHFDTAPQYGQGASEENLGRILASLKPNVVVSTKVRVPPAERQRIGAFIATSMEASLKRLRRDNVDLFQLHNPLAMQVEGEKLTPDEVLGEVVPALQRLRDQGKTRFLGLTAIGDTAALHRVVDSRAFDVAQVPYNALNPSPGEALPKDYPAQDYGRLLERTQAAGMGTIGIRVLAGGALSGREERHPLGMQAVEPIGSGSSYKADVRARAAARADGARGPCGEPDRARHALRHRPSRVYRRRRSGSPPSISWRRRHGPSTRARCRRRRSRGSSSCRPASLASRADLGAENAKTAAPQ